MKAISEAHMEIIMKRAQRQPSLMGSPEKGSRCLICGKPWNDCPHSVYDVKFVSQEVERRRIFSHTMRSDT